MPSSLVRNLFRPSRKRGRLYFSIVNIGNWVFLGTLPVTLEFMVRSEADVAGLALYFANWTAAAIFAVLSPFAVAQRCRDIGWSGWIVVLSFVPVVNFALGMVLMIVPGQPGRPAAGECPEGVRA